MNVAVGSMWRDSHAYIDRTLDQCARLAKEFDAAGDTVEFVWVENASTDDTFDRLTEFARHHIVSLEQRVDGCPYFASEDRRDRWQHLAWVANGVLEQVTENVDRFIYVESDLAWEPSTLLALLARLDEVDVCSPLNMRATGQYYDLWGSRGMDGRRFTAQPPHHLSLLEPDYRGLVEVQAVAGCTAMIGDVARMTRFSRDDCYVGWNRDMRLSGWDVWCDPQLQVVHA